MGSETHNVRQTAREKTKARKERGRRESSEEEQDNAKGKDEGLKSQKAKQINKGKERVEEVRGREAAEATK